MTATATSVSPFSFGTHAVRVIVKDGAPWFVAKDICDTLGYSNSRKTLADHLDDDEKGVTNSDTLGGSQKLTIINESGLYALVLRSRKPEARKFAKWVTSEVLPAIRKTGGYELPNLYKQQPGDKLNSYQQQQLRGLLEEFVKHLPKDKQAGFMMQGWSKLKSHFGVAYREIPCERFDEAVSLLTRHVVEHAKPQPIEAQPGRIRVNPQTLIENAARIAGQLFGEALKQGALGGSPIDRFVVTADYKGGQCNMEVIERDAYVLPLPRLAEVIRSSEPIALSEVAALMGACAEKLARHHAPRLAA